MIFSDQYSNFETFEFSPEWIILVNFTWHFSSESKFEYFKMFEKKFEYFDVTVIRETWFFTAGVLHFWRGGCEMFSLVFTAFDRGSRPVRGNSYYSNRADCKRKTRLENETIPDTILLEKKKKKEKRKKSRSRSEFGVCKSQVSAIYDEYWILSFTVVTRISYTTTREVLEYVIKIYRGGHFLATCSMNRNKEIPHTNMN